MKGGQCDCREWAGRAEGTEKEEQRNMDLAFSGSGMVPRANYWLYAQVSFLTLLRLNWGQPCTRQKLYLLYCVSGLLNLSLAGGF